MKRKWYFLVLPPSLIGFFLFPIFHLELKDRSQNRVCFVVRVSEGDLLRFSYIHSVEKTPVKAILRIERKGLKVIETDTPSYGAGLPNVVPHHQVRKEKGTFRVLANSEVMNQFTFFISAVTHPILQIKGKKILLAEMVREGGVMELRVKRAPTFLFFLKKVFYN